ncbi:hypothetical protein R1flu_010521 [Riccia fluitans]|uniref:Uncharacterized protein n=1 Tax=Riccia fluitans TaxID=41844 RepID=A0ABD1Z7P9_9MARC
MFTTGGREKVCTPLLTSNAVTLLNQSRACRGGQGDANTKHFRDPTQRRYRTRCDSIPGQEQQMTSKGKQEPKPARKLYSSGHSGCSVKVP